MRTEHILSMSKISYLHNVAYGLAMLNTQSAGKTSPLSLDRLPLSQMTPIFTLQLDLHI